MNSTYYDEIHKRIVADLANQDSWLTKRFEYVAPHVCGSVLDLGCGLGAMAEHVQGDYTGVDFSWFATYWARENYGRPGANFYCADIGDLPAHIAPHDTVLMLELLEHLPDYAPAVATALRYARRRIVATVPRDMPGKAHYHPRWDVARLADALGGELLTCELFGGDDGRRWWLAVRDV